MTSKVTFNEPVRSGPSILIGANDLVEGSNWSQSVELHKSKEGGGELTMLNVVLTADIAPPTPQGTICIFTDDPGFSTNDSDSGSDLVWSNYLHSFEIDAADWVTDGVASFLSKVLAVPFDECHTLSAAFLLRSGESSINSTGSDNIVMSVTGFIRNDN